MEQEFDALSPLTTTLPKITHDPDRSKLLSLLAIMGYNQMELFTQDECSRAADRLREYRTVTGDNSETVKTAIERLTARATANDVIS